MEGIEMPYKDPEARKAYARAHYKPKDPTVRRAYDQKRYQVDRKKRDAQAAAWRAAHTEEVKARAAAYHLAHKEECNARSVAYRIKHTEEVKAREVAYRAAHIEEYRARDATYHLKHTEKIKARQAMYRECLADNYIAGGFRIPIAKCPPELIELKREHLKNVRVYRQLKQTIGEINEQQK
jgi:hypothetical protein